MCQYWYAYNSLINTVQEYKCKGNDESCITNKKMFGFHHLLLFNAIGKKYYISIYSGCHLRLAGITCSLNTSSVPSVKKKYIVCSCHDDALGYFYMLR